MIKESPELVAVARRWLQALEEKDTETLGNMFSKSEYLRYVGTDENEIWSGDLVREGYADHANEIPDITMETQRIEAFECGSMGWAFFSGSLAVSGMESVLTERVTWVFVLEAGSWKIAQAHLSFPKPNLDVIGVEHIAFEELIESAKSTYSHQGNEGTATVMFTDIVNSTSIASAVGDRAWASTISWHLESVTSIIEENGGSVVKTLGDGTMSTFLSARGAMSAARAIQSLVTSSQREPQLQIRIGLHTGDVIQSEGDFFGSVVNKAARIASAAAPSQVLVSDATRVMVGNNPEFSFADPVAVILKGFEGEQSISTLEWS